MATKQRRAGNRTTGRKRTAGRRRQGARRAPSRRGARSGARQAQRGEVARLVQVAPEPRRDDNDTGEQAAEPTPMWGTGVPGFARQVADAAESGAVEAVRRTEAAEAELARRREEAEAYRANGEEGFPGLSAIGIELALGAMRLARTIATAPLRIGLAFLRPREA
jgi:hypothetical protein